MFIHLPNLTLAMVLMAGQLFHSLHSLFFQEFHTVDHPQSLALRLNGREDGLHPGIRFSAQVQKQVTLLYRQNIRGGRLVGVTLRPRRQQQ